MSSRKPRAYTEKKNKQKNCFVFVLKVNILKKCLVSLGPQSQGGATVGVPRPSPVPSSCLLPSPPLSFPAGNTQAWSALLVRPEVEGLGQGSSTTGQTRSSC